MDVKENNEEQGEDSKYCGWRVMSPEIVEIAEDTKSGDGGIKDVYVAVGKDDLDVVKWAIDHAVSLGARIFLVHVFPPFTYISTPVGRLSKCQLSQEQARFYINEENDRRRNLLQKYIRLCNDAKVAVDTVLLENNSTAKAILELVLILNITDLVMGTERPLSSRWLMKRMGKGEFVKKNAPKFCEVTIVYEGMKLMDGQQVEPYALPSSHPGSDISTRQSERNFFDYICFLVKSD